DDRLSARARGQPRLPPARAGQHDRAAAGARDEQPATAVARARVDALTRGRTRPAWRALSPRQSRARQRSPPQRRYCPPPGGRPMAFAVVERSTKSARHTTSYLSCGATDAPPIVFVHGWPELSLSWRHQLPCFASLGFHAVAPDMRGYGGSSVYARHEDY